MRCTAQMRRCPVCDAGQRYCGSSCAADQRRRAQRAASRAYQATRRGALLHAVRMQRYRDRKRSGDRKFAAPIVTQQLGPEARTGDKTGAETRTSVGPVEEATTHASILAMQPA
jgi:hypothetical protein